MKRSRNQPEHGPGEFIVRGSWGNIIVDHATGKVLRINEQEEDGYADITRFDPATLVPIKLTDGTLAYETDILHTAYYYKRPDSQHERRVWPIVENCDGEPIPENVAYIEDKKATLRAARRERAQQRAIKPEV